MTKMGQPVTKDYLDEKLIEFKEDFRSEIVQAKENLREEIAIGFERYDEKNRGYRDQVLTGLDKVMKELETIREETTIGDFQTKKQLKDHEKRLTKLETQ